MLRRSCAPSTLAAIASTNAVPASPACNIVIVAIALGDFQNLPHSKLANSYMPSTLCVRVGLMLHEACFSFNPGESPLAGMLVALDGASNLSQGFFCIVMQTSNQDFMGDAGAKFQEGWAQSGRLSVMKFGGSTRAARPCS